MTKVKYTNIGSIIMMTILFAAFTMINSGCGNESVLTEPEDMDEAYPMNPESAPDWKDTIPEPVVDPGSDGKDIIPPSVDTSIEVIEVEAGQTFSFSLESNPSTGYSWQAQFDSEFLKLVESVFVEGSSGLIGAPGHESFKFLALKEGQVDIKMIYKRSWEPDHIDEQIKVINIVPIVPAGNPDDAKAQTVDTKVGETFTISLKSNPTTGFSWQPEFDSDFLKLVSKDYRSDSTLPGSPGVEFFEFEAIKQGEVKVKMIYKRPWEPRSLEEQVILIDIAPTN
jgi:inhibitor of cysteine peptidase